jgi:hypothetical protein
MRFISFGYRYPEQFDGLYASGQLYDLVTSPIHNTRRVQKFIHLASPINTEDEIQGGMSGAPVYHPGSNSVLGIIVGYDHSGHGNIPLAIPIESMTSFRPINERLVEEIVLKLLESLLAPGTHILQKDYQEFYESLTFPFLRPYKELKEPEDKKQLGLLNQLRGENYWYDLIQFLESNYRFIPLDEIRKNIPRVWLVDFVNRTEERKRACEEYGPPYLLFDGPDGYGKKELLKTIEREHFCNRWFPVSAVVKENHATVYDIAAQLAEQAGCSDDISHHTEIGKIAVALATSLKNQVKLRQAQGLLISISEIEWLPADEIDIFLGTFLREFHIKNLKFHVRLAGRYVASRWKKQAEICEVLLVTQALTPFKFEFVKQTVVNSLERSSNSSEIDSCAANLMHITGGHPGCMAEILSKIPRAERIEEHFSEQESSYNEIVLLAAEKVRSGIPDDLKNIFDTLCIFRRYNQVILDAMLGKKMIAFDGNIEHLEMRLTTSLLISRSKDAQFLRDDVTRRLLFIRLRLMEPERFRKLCAQACDIMDDCLRQSDDRPDIYAMDTIFQQLQCRYYASNQSFTEREVLRRDLFAPGGILENTLSILSTKKNWLMHRNALANMILQDDEWDFQFSVNYYLRSNTYAKDPVQELSKAILNHS